MPKVLVFESDEAFAETLRKGLAAYDCQTEIASDGEAGIAAAEQAAPDLILLSIELPRMNGFSVCNKLKRNGALKAVPLIIMSSEATDDTFEQHKRLRTRAEEYIHKPITVDELVARIQSLVPLSKMEVLDAEEDLEEVMIDEVEEEVEEATDIAFGNLVSSPEAAPPAVAADVEALELEADSALRVASAPPPGPPPRKSEAPLVAASVSTGVNPEVLEKAEKALSEAHARISKLEEELALARDDAKDQATQREQLERRNGAELEILQNEVTELRAKVEKTAGAGTAREFLDLREQLNRKDKEIIEMRDQLSSREKEVVLLTDANIAGEREKADLLDQVQDLDRTRTELEKARDALALDKAQAEKRGDDYKQKSERLTEQLEAKSDELKQALESHEHEMARRDAQEASQREDHRRAMDDAAKQAALDQEQAVARAVLQAEQAAAAAEEAALTAAAEEAARVQALALAAREKELRAEHDAKMAALHRANEEAMRKLRAEHEHAMEVAAEEAAERLSRREADLFREKEAAVAYQKDQDQTVYDQLLGEKQQGESQRDARIAHLETDLAEREGELAEARKTIDDREGRIAQLEADLAATRADLVENREALSDTETLLGAARGKWMEDSAALKEAQEALASASRALSAALGRPMP